MENAEPVILRVSGDVDFFERENFRLSLEKLLTPETVIIDFSQTDYMDSSGISQVLLLARERARAQRSAPRIVAGPGVARLFEVAGLAIIVPVVSTMEEALTL